MGWGEERDGWVGRATQWVGLKFTANLIIQFRRAWSAHRCSTVLTFNECKRHIFISPQCTMDTGSGMGIVSYTG